jgi:hypothetical protein
MVLFLFYNADLLEIVETDDQYSLAFVDNVNIAIEAKTFREANRQTRHLMEKPGGGYDWSKDHNSQFELTKLAAAGFSQKQVKKPGTRKTQRIVRPDLVLRDTTIKMTSQIKSLGILLDDELRWGGSCAIRAS